MNQQYNLMLGIEKLRDTYKNLYELNFSDTILDQIQDMVDDLMGLVEDPNIEKRLSQDIWYDENLKKYIIITRKVGE